MSKIDKVNLATVEKMWRREVEAAHTYKLLAGRESDPKRRDILLRLAAQEDTHAARWSERSRRRRAACPIRRSSSAAFPGSSASAIRTSCCIASSRRRRRPRKSTTG